MFHWLPQGPLQTRYKLLSECVSDEVAFNKFYAVSQLFVKMETQSPDQNPIKSLIRERC